MRKLQFILLPACLLFVLAAPAQTKQTASSPKTVPATAKKSATAAPAKKPAVATPAKDTLVKTTPRVAVDSVKPSQAVVAAPVAPVAEQKNPKIAATTVVSPFKKGTLRVTNQSSLFYSNTKTKGVSNYDLTDLTGLVSLTYFPIDGLGIGVDAGIYNYKMTGPTSPKYNSWYSYFHLMYGHTFNERVNAYIKLGYGPARSNSEFRNGSQVSKLKSSFHDISGTVGAPIRIEEGGRLFLTPFFTYDQYKGKAGTHDITDKNRSFGIRLESYLAPSAGKKTGTGGKNNYLKGNQFIDYNTGLYISSSTRDEYQGTTRFVPRTTNNSQLNLNYGLYFIDNLAGGLNIQLTGHKEKTTGSTAIKRTNFSVRPTILAHLPVEGPLSNAFVQAAYLISRGSESGQIKLRESGPDFHVGYNLFFHSSLALVPRIGYSSNKHTTISATGGASSNRENGLVADLTLRSWLNWKWLK